MKLITRHFGEIEIDESEIIDFPDGILGFEDVKKYVLINNPDPEVPFQWLQSVDEPSLAFVITNPFLFKSDYEFDIPQNVLKKLEIEETEDVAVYSIAVVPDDIKDMTINLRGPVIINVKKKKAKQIVLDKEEYSLKYKIFENAKRAG
ncbi:flagellar assembly factor FliW [Caminicella sporogenes DSM 14501]|uniref:Flagellar assembly factor FliW n=1 Tax=Caminicella sporogenes DSM 14501 TaxID=1121266 RepID=A0A1M6Q221_9FIRM|nr:flagellar assembly protein FliW [Caminicella sporogenes]RKD23545.1 flagellar assembly protein FliW [Caminicella sporogenes]SHK14157.1 flagellar assembly factor FliW [Caminicella sporogenes DSM 14501]